MAIANGSYSHVIYGALTATKLYNKILLPIGCVTNLNDVLVPNDTMIALRC